jgi:MerR family transcriptional regulator, repressor of the yfmOP operon
MSSLIDNPRTLRIGEVAERTGTTPRTIRYYEEIGLLPSPAGHEKGRHRTYGEADVQRLEELLRLRQLLGVTLEELKELAEREEARSVLRAEWQQARTVEQRRRILEQSLEHVGRQLELVRGRRDALAQLEQELVAKQERVTELLGEL